jgi:hypothetical protein
MWNEFKPVDVVLEDRFDPAKMTRGEYIRYFFLDSSEVEKHSDGETRDYEIEFVYYFDTKYYRTKKAFDDVYSDRIEHLKQLLDENRSYTSDSTYRWHNLTVEPEPLMTVEELEEVEDEHTIAQRFLVTITRSNFR